MQIWIFFDIINSQVGSAQEMTLREYIEKILLLQGQRDYETAYDILGEALSYYPNSDFLLASEVYLLFKLSRIKEAREKAEKRLEILKTNSFFLKTYIDILLKEGDRDTILNIAERISSWNITNDKSYIVLARALSKIGQRKQAIELIRSAMSFLKDNKELAEYLAELINPTSEAGINYYRKRFKGVPVEKAISEIENIMVLPDYRDDTSIRLFLAELYRKTGNLGGAVDIYLDILKIMESPYVRKMLGFTYYRMGEFEKALFYLKEPFIHNPEDHAVYTTVSRILQKTQDIKGAEAMINEALSRKPEAGHLYGLMRKLKTNKQ